MYQLRLGLFGVLALTISSPLFAADMSYKAPMAAPVAASGWNGWYVGGQLGFKSVTNDWTTDCVQGGGLATCGNALNALEFPGAPDSSASNRFTTSNFRYGFYAGAMSQVFTNYVVGIEGDVGFYNNSSTVPGILGCSTAACTGGALMPFDLSGDSTSVKNTYDYSLRLRAGYLVTPDILVYGTGGIAFQHVEASMACNGATSPACFIGNLSQTDSTTMQGYTVGGGLEWKLMQNWLIRGEYRYSDFGTWKPSFFQNSGIVEVYPSIHVTSQIATAGIAYMFPISR
jgi:outer membrane immunogenic protein